jgi:hypothetical protein
MRAFIGNRQQKHTRKGGQTQHNDKCSHFAPVGSTQDPCKRTGSSKASAEAESLSGFAGGSLLGRFGFAQQVKAPWPEGRVR